jgi:hypothetical protein
MCFTDQTVEGACSHCFFVMASYDASYGLSVLVCGFLGAMGSGAVLTGHVLHTLSKLPT